MIFVASTLKYDPVGCLWSASQRKPSINGKEILSSIAIAAFGGTDSNHSIHPLEVKGGEKLPKLRRACWRRLAPAPALTKVVRASSWLTKLS